MVVRIVHHLLIDSPINIKILALYKLNQICIGNFCKHLVTLKPLVWCTFFINSAIFSDRPNFNKLFLKIFRYGTLSKSQPFKKVQARHTKMFEERHQRQQQKQQQQQEEVIETLAFAVEELMKQMEKKKKELEEVIDHEIELSEEIIGAYVWRKSGLKWGIERYAGNSKFTNFSCQQEWSYKCTKRKYQKLKGTGRGKG